MDPEAMSKSTALPAVQLIFVGCRRSMSTPWTSAGGGTGVPTQLPLWQVSGVVQVLASLQVVPFAAIGFEQTPDPGLQTPATWH
jgi:hypothetical protein